MDDDFKRRIVAEAMRKAEEKYKNGERMRSIDKAPNKITPKTKKRNSGAAGSKNTGNEFLKRIEQDAKKEREKEIDEFLSKLNKSIQSSSELRELWGIDDDSFRYNRNDVINDTEFHVYYIFLPRNMQNNSEHTLLFYNPNAARQFFEVRVKIKKDYVDPTIKQIKNRTSIFIDRAFDIDGSPSEIEKYCYDTSRAKKFHFKTEIEMINVEEVLDPFLYDYDDYDYDMKRGCEISIYWPLNRDRVENARDNAAKLEEQFGETAQNALENTSSDPEQE